MRSWISRLNEQIAVIGTKAFSSPWTLYAFFIWGLLGLLPFLPKEFTGLVLLVSSAWIQLFSLPLLAVGNAVLNRESERRAIQDHRMLTLELTELKDMQKDNEEILKKLDQIENLLDNIAHGSVSQLPVTSLEDTDDRSIAAGNQTAD